MSTTNTHPTRETYLCEACGHPTPASATIAGSFCSTQCHARHRGQKLLNKLREDHTYCYTCFARLKTTEEPSEQWTQEKASRVVTALDQGATFVPGPGGQMVLDATRCEYSEVVDVNQITGFQYGTEHSTRGVIEDPVDDYRVIEREGLICRCGNTHHRNREEAIQTARIVEVARNLTESLHELQEAGVHDYDLDGRVLVKALRAQVDQEGWDFALAVGEALDCTPGRGDLDG